MLEEDCEIKMKQKKFEVYFFIGFTILNNFFMSTLFTINNSFSLFSKIFFIFIYVFSNVLGRFFFFKEKNNIFNICYLFLIYTILIFITFFTKNYVVLLILNCLRGLFFGINNNICLWLVKEYTANLKHRSANITILLFAIFFMFLGFIFPIKLMKYLVFLFNLFGFVFFFQFALLNKISLPNYIQDKNITILNDIFLRLLLNIMFIFLQSFLLKKMIINLFLFLKTGYWLLFILFLYYKRRKFFFQRLVSFFFFMQTFCNFLHYTTHYKIFLFLKEEFEVIIIKLYLDRDIKFYTKMLHQSISMQDRVKNILFGTTVNKKLIHEKSFLSSSILKFLSLL